MRKCDTRSNQRETPENVFKLQRYLEFSRSLEDHTRLVFADEKPMKELMIFSKTRRDIYTGYVPKNIVPSTAKNRFNILCAVNLKGGNVAPVYYNIIEESTDSALFIQFVNNLIDNNVLQEGDFFVVDNCTVHNKGDNVGLEDALWDLHCIQLLLLPPYTPELNPTELVFCSLLMKLISKNRCYNSIDAYDFVDAIAQKLDEISDLNEVERFYQKCTYHNF